ncbi:substrate-binding domain-containing protein [Microbacterium sp. GXF0217]
MLGEVLGLRGYRTSIVLAARRGISPFDRRIEGFRDAFERAGGEIARCYRGEISWDSGIEMARQALAEGIEAGTVVVAVDDIVALAAMSVINGAGREVGADVAICGFGDIPAVREARIGLTTVRVPARELDQPAFHEVTENAYTLDQRRARPAVLIRDTTPRRESRMPRRHSS